MTRVRRLGTAAMIVPLAVASALMVGAAPAAADGEILSPTDGQVIKAPGPVSVSAKTDWYQVSMSLYVEGPSVSRQKIGSGGANQTISGTFDPGDAPNGTFTVTLAGEVTHKTYATSTFVLSRPPEAPTGVDAQLKGRSTLVVSWAKGAEPDLQSYEVSSTKAGKSGSYAVDSACSGSTCRANLALPAQMAGEKVDVSVRAFRSDGTGGSVASEPSATAYVSVPAPKPSPSPSPTPTKKQGSADTKPAGTTPKTHPPTAAPNPVPTLPKDTGKELTPPKGGDDELKLPEASGGGEQTEPEIAPEKSDSPKTTAQSSFSPLGGLSFGVYVAIAVVLLLIGANLGAWLRRKGVTGEPAARKQPGPTAAHGGAAKPGAAARGTATVNGRSATPARRPAVILAKPRPKPQEDLPGPETETQAELTAILAEGTGDETNAHGLESTPTYDQTEERNPAPTYGQVDERDQAAVGDGQVLAASVADKPSGAPSSVPAVMASPGPSSEPSTVSSAAPGPMPSAEPSVLASTVSSAVPSVLPAATGAAGSPAVGSPGVGSTGKIPAATVLSTPGAMTADAPLNRLASLPPLSAAVSQTVSQTVGQRSGTPARLPVPPAAQPAQMPPNGATVGPAGPSVAGQMPERPLRQPEPDVWDEEDPYPGRHRDI